MAVEGWHWIIIVGSAVAVGAFIFVVYRKGRQVRKARNNKAVVEYASTHNVFAGLEDPPSKHHAQLSRQHSNIMPITQEDRREDDSGTHTFDELVEMIEHGGSSDHFHGGSSKTQKNVKFPPGQYKILFKTRSREGRDLKSDERVVLGAGQVVTIIKTTLYKKRIRGKIDNCGWITMEDLDRKKEFVEFLAAIDDSEEEIDGSEIESTPPPPDRPPPTNTDAGVDIVYEPAWYLITHFGCQITEECDVDSAILETIYRGAVVNVVDVQTQGTRIRGEISTGGWITLADTEKEWVWAERTNVDDHDQSNIKDKKRKKKKKKKEDVKYDDDGSPDPDSLPNLPDKKRRKKKRRDNKERPERHRERREGDEKRHEDKKHKKKRKERRQHDDKKHRHQKDDEKHRSRERKKVKKDVDELEEEIYKALRERRKIMKRRRSLDNNRRAERKREKRRNKRDPQDHKRRSQSMGLPEKYRQKKRHNAHNGDGFEDAEPNFRYEIPNYYGRQPMEFGYYGYYPPQPFYPQWQPPFDPRDPRARHRDHRTASHPDHRTAGHPDHRTAGHPDHRTAGHPDHRTTGHPDHRTTDRRNTDPTQKMEELAE